MKYALQKLTPPCPPSSPRPSPGSCKSMADPIYKNVISGTEPLYQQYFERILELIDVQNFTNQTLARPHEKSRIEGDNKIVEELINLAKEKDNLLPVVLQIMLDQYFWADVYMREMGKEKWIYRVMNRKDEDFFPDSMTVYKTLFESES